LDLFSASSWTRRKDVVTLISVAEQDLTANPPTRILMRQLMGAVAQYDKSQIVLKLRGARMRRRAAEGRCEGRQPFGKDKSEQAVVGRMKALRGKGLAFDKIAERLNLERVPTRTGKRWHEIVKNRILSGHR
jgi:DNA invertase Pin-like site-specific DNA recombinase